MPGDLHEVFHYIDAHAESFIQELLAFLSQPCVVVRREGIQESAEHLRGLLAGLGASVEVMSAASSPPALFAQLDGETSTSLLFYNHYDVQPEDPIQEWTSPPFEPQVRDGRVFARGVADNRGDLLARIFAVRSFLSTIGNLPLSVKFFFEGEEEVGSPNLPEMVSRNAAKLKSDGCLWESGSRSASGRPQLFLGLKGMCAVELKVTGPASDLHSSNATLVQNPAWRLVSALNSLRSSDGRILIPGFYVGVRPPSEEELLLARSIPFEEPEMKAKWGISSFVGGVSGEQALHTHLFEPTCNICGLTSGYHGQGVKTVLPRAASAKLDFRLVPDQTPERVLELLRSHLDASGFQDIGLIPQGGLLPARTSPNALISSAAISAARLTYPVEPVVFPSMPASGPMSFFTENLATPTVCAGVGNDRSNIHGPDENILVEDFILGIKYVVRLIHEMARLSAGGPGVHKSASR